MLGRFLKAVANNCDQITTSRLLSNLTHWVHCTNAYLNDTIHVIPLITHYNFNSQVFNEDLNAIKLTLIVHVVFLF